MTRAPTPGTRMMYEPSRLESRIAFGYPEVATRAARSASAVAAAHGASIAVKRVVRRHRPTDPSVAVLVGTPSRLSFPSSHAASTTAAAVVYGGLLRRPLTPVLVPPMLVSRLVLGVHYPTDVLVGSALGAAIGAGVRRRLRSSHQRGWR